MWMNSTQCEVEGNQVSWQTPGLSMLLITLFSLYYNLLIIGTFPVRVSANDSGSYWAGLLEQPIGAPGLRRPVLGWSLPSWTRFSKCLKQSQEEVQKSSSVSDHLIYNMLKGYYEIVSQWYQNNVNVPCSLQWHYHMHRNETESTLSNHRSELLNKTLVHTINTIKKDCTIKKLHWNVVDDRVFYAPLFLNKHFVMFCQGWPGCSAWPGLNNLVG